MCLLISEIQVQTPCVSFNGDPEHDQSLSTRSSALCCSQDLGSLLVNSFATMDDNKKIQETRNLRSKIQIRVRKPQEIKKMKKEANCWVLDSNSNDIFPRHDKGMVDCTLRMLEEWRIHKCGEEVMMRMEINKDYHRLISDIIATTAFGSSYEEGIELFRSQSELEEYFVASLTSVSSQENNAKLKSNFMNYGDNLLGIKLKAATSKESETAMRMDEIIEECKAIYISGQVNSMILLTWTTLLLSLNQYWQEKLREEVFNECGKDTIPDSDTFSRLKLMNMVLMESLRLYGPVIKMVREATHNMKIGHLDIPKGTSIIVPFLKMHTDKAIWGEDAKQFNPMRFENGVSQAANHPNALLSFSVRPRTCIAQNFAMMETKTVLTMILQRFRIILSPVYKHAPVDYFNIYPQYGLPVMLKPLDTSAQR
ncbi:unnamed protein product [Brassica oleracea]|uniref:(rape) hypothetical protein n=1 Tax=Brassica napus TaxID=3708 RepID=A0A816MT59_BRANA|nr:unnamed protein product [Brassica napus]